MTKNEKYIQKIVGELLDEIRKIETRKSSKRLTFSVNLTSGGITCYEREDHKRVVLDV